MNGELFERCLVDAIQDIADENNIKHKPLAEKAWPDCKDPGTKWRKIRNGTEPRGLYVCDAYDLVEALGVSFLEVWGIAQNKFKDKLKEKKCASDNDYETFQCIQKQSKESEAMPCSRDALPADIEKVR